MINWDHKRNKYTVDYIVDENREYGFHDEDLFESDKGFYLQWNSYKDGVKTIKCLSKSGYRECYVGEDIILSRNKYKSEFVSLPVTFGNTISYGTLAITIYKFQLRRKSQSNLIEFKTDTDFGHHEISFSRNTIKEIFETLNNIKKIFLRAEELKGSFLQFNLKKLIDFNINVKPLVFDDFIELISNLKYKYSSHLSVRPRRDDIENEYCTYTGVKNDHYTHYLLYCYHNGENLVRHSGDKVVSIVEKPNDLEEYREMGITKNSILYSMIKRYKFDDLVAFSFLSKKK